MPAADRDLLDQQAHEALSTLEVECVDPARGELREAGNSASQPVVDGEIVPLGEKSGALVCKACAASVDFPGTPLQIREFHETSLVQIGQTPPLCLCGLELAPEPGELGVEQLVVGCRSVSRESALACEEDVGSQ